MWRSLQKKEEEKRLGNPGVTRDDRRAPTAPLPNSEKGGAGRGERKKKRKEDGGGKTGEQERRKEGGRGRRTEKEQGRE